MAARKKRSKKTVTKARSDQDNWEEKRLMLAGPQAALQRWQDIGVLDTQEEYEAAGAAYAQAAQLARDVDETRKEETRHLDAAKKLIVARYRPLSDFYKGVAEHTKELVQQYDEEARIRREKQAERRAKAAEKRGEPASFAMAIREQAAAETAPNPYVVIVQAWTGEVEDMKALCKAIGEGKAPVELVTPNQKELTRLAKQYEGDMGERFPGTRSFLSRTTRRR